jgi:hypothetical protein
MSELSQMFVFQADSDIVKNAYQNKDNYLIEYDESQTKEHCAIYFSSNEIYYPNEEDVFRRSILEQNKFEWFGTRVPYAHKHIFIRDIQKQWYLTGVNATIDSPEKLLEFLKTETDGYEVTALGSSAGGFAAVLFGSLLEARLMLSFNGQFQVHSLFNTSKESVNPILFRFKRTNTLLNYFDAKPFVTEGKNIFYFCSNASGWDCEQRDHIQDKNIHMIAFSTAHHGIPFLKCNLPVILKMSKEELMGLSGKVFSPLVFSVRMVGLVNTLSGLFEQLRKKYL